MILPPSPGHLSFEIGLELLDMQESSWHHAHEGNNQHCFQYMIAAPTPSWPGTLVLTCCQCFNLCHEWPVEWIKGGRGLSIS